MAQEYPTIEAGASLIVAYQVTNKPVLLIGGGQVAAGRLLALLNAGAKVTIVSPLAGLSEEVHHRIFSEQVVDQYLDRNFDAESPDDQQLILSFALVFTAIDEPNLSSKVCKLCRSARIPINVADVPPECDFYFGSIVRRGPLQIMVSTQGKGPRIANRIRRQIEASLPPNVGNAIDQVGKLRVGLRKIAPGKDTETIARRMDWMVRVCDGWSLDQLAQMNDDMREEVLDGWEDGVAKRYWEVQPGVGGKAMAMWTRATGWAGGHDNSAGRKPTNSAIVGLGSFVLGLATAGLIFAARSQARR